MHSGRNRGKRKSTHLKIVVKEIEKKENKKWLKNKLFQKICVNI
jgi:hypothetical protein